MTVPVINDLEEVKIANVLIIAGQSNAEYGDIHVCDPAELNAEYQEVPTHNLYYYGTSTQPANQWDWSHQYQYSWSAFHLHEMYGTDAWKIGGYEPILGNHLSNANGHDTLRMLFSPWSRKRNIRIR